MPVLNEQEFAGDVPVHEMTDSRALQLVRLMSALAGAAYLSRASLLPDIMFEMARQSIRHGFGQIGAQAFLGPALTFRIIGDRATAQRLTDVGERMLPKTHKDFLGKSLFLLHGFHRHWTQPWSTTRSALIAAQQAALAAGECEYAGHALNIRNMLDVFSGMPLAELVESILKNKALSEQAGREHIHYTNLCLQVVHELQQRVPNRASFDGPFHKDSEDLPPALTAIRAAMRHYVEVFYRMGTSEANLDPRHLSAVEEVVPAGVWTPYFYQYACLVWLHAGRQPRPLMQRQELLWQAWRGLRKLRQWAKLYSLNFGHRANLIEAEWLRTWGRRRTAIAFYEQALAQAENGGFAHEAALTRELLAEVLLELGQTDRARPLLQKARQAYSDWGATGKVRDLDARYAALLCKPDARCR